MRKIALLLALCLLLSAAPLPAAASGLPQEVIPAQNETLPQAYIPVQTQASTLPQEEIPVQTQSPAASSGPAAPSTSGDDFYVVVEDAAASAPGLKKSEAPFETVASPIPIYFQNDYPRVRYGTGSIANNGCSITSLAMVATYLTGYTYMPDQLARWFGADGNNNMERLEYGSTAMGLPFEKNTNWHITKEALKQGKISITLMEDCDFTTTQHFIVLTGITAEGRILVNDPNSKNYTNWKLKDGFLNGFRESQIVEGIAGSWVYDPAAMPVNPIRYYEEELDRTTSNYPTVRLDKEDTELLARVIWVEAQGESKEGQQAVAEVVLNRLVSDSFPDTVHGVIYAENQFRSVPYLEDAEPSQAQYEAIDYALYGTPVLPQEVFYFATFPTNSKVWGEIGGHTFCYAEDYPG